jgi:2-keto-4-pentenoate hydratase/2-oxohepta-3-ene-1,7-dioic acid hydratase in catechol pathway
MIVTRTQDRNGSTRFFAAGLLAFLAVALAGTALAAPPVKYCRFQADGRTSYGIVEGDRVRALSAAPFGPFEKTDKTYPLSAVKLLAPTEPTQVLAMAFNYRSHFAMGGTPLKDGEELPARHKYPQPFFKSPSCIIGQGDEIVIPADSKQTDYEGEMVIVIGKRAKSVPKDKALEYVLGVTCGNDISERYWQNDEKNQDVQWWRCKSSDTFGPVGPFVVSGLDYDKLPIQLRLNGKVKQDVNTSSMIHDVRTIVSFISRYVTLHPGDLIFTGTTGTTEPIKAGDVVEVEIQGIGTLRNPVTREKS